jgi:hypothetical protein
MSCKNRTVVFQRCGQDVVCNLEVRDNNNDKYIIFDEETFNLNLSRKFTCRIITIMIHVLLFGSLIAGGVGIYYLGKNHGFLKWNKQSFM